MNTIEAKKRIAEFEKKLREQLPGGLGSALTRSEHALLLTFLLWNMNLSDQETESPE